MIYSVRLYTVDFAHVSVFLETFRRGSLWTDIARLQPGHIHTDLLRNPSDSRKFMSIEFWMSINMLLAAGRALELRGFAGWLNRHGIDCEGLGMFVFPPQRGALALDSGELACPPIDEGQGLESEGFEAEVL